MALLEVRNLQFRYGMIQALKGISFHVEEGEIVTLIGANGSGKTTTLRSISGLHKGGEPSGEILFGSENLIGIEPHKITARGLSQVIEGRHIFPQLTVMENIRVGAYLQRDDTKVGAVVEKMFQLFPRLKERTNQMGGTLSGGEQQMLAIVRAMVSMPKILLMDEPSLGLAPIIVSEIFEKIRELNKTEGLTILLVEQNSKVALDVADRGYVMASGTIELEGTAKHLRGNEDVRKTYLGG